MISTYPGSRTRILDYSQYVPKLGQTACGAIVTASKGPTDTRTLITTKGQLRETFGPVSSDNKSLLSVKGYLDYGQSLYVVRVASYNEAYSSVDILDGDSNASVAVTAATSGTHGDNIKVVVSAGSDGGDYYKLVVKYNDVVYEEFDNVLVGTAYTSNSDYIDTRINGESEFISVVDDASYDSITAGTYTLTGGNDGSDVTNSDVVGTEVGATRTGLQLFENAEDVDINILIAPGFESDAVISAMDSIAETRNDCTYLVAPPYGYTYQQAIDWHNGSGPGADDPSSALNDWRGAAYAPWVKTYDSDSDTYMWVNPVGHVAGVYANTDEVSYKWRAPAGPNRGKLKNVSDIEYNVTNAQHGIMCPVSGGAGQNNLNPIRNISGEGIMVYSQKTLYRSSTSRRDVNVVRLLQYVMKVITTATKYLRWEPNDEVTWREFENLCNPELESIQGTRGLYDFTVVCEDIMEQRDDLVNNDTMLGQLFMKPVRTAEVIVHDFTLMNYGAEFDVSDF